MKGRCGLLAVLCVLCSVLVMLLMAGAEAATPPGKGPKKPAAKNIILLIADGQRYNHVLAGAGRLQPGGGRRRSVGRAAQQLG